MGNFLNSQKKIENINSNILKEQKMIKNLKIIKGVFIKIFPYKF